MSVKSAKALGEMPLVYMARNAAAMEGAARVYAAAGCSRRAGECEARAEAWRWMEAAREAQLAARQYAFSEHRRPM